MSICLCTSWGKVVEVVNCGGKLLMLWVTTWNLLLLRDDSDATEKTKPNRVDTWFVDVKSLCWKAISFLVMLKFGCLVYDVFFGWRFVVVCYNSGLMEVVGEWWWWYFDSEREVSEAHGGVCYD